MPATKRIDIDWDSQPLGKMSDADLAKQIGCGWRTVYRNRQKRGIKAFQVHHAPTPELIADLGTMTDVAVATKHETSAAYISILRKRLGIASFSTKGRKSTGVPRRIPDRIIKQLGKKSDIQLAKEAGVHFSAIWHHRTKRNIPAFNQKDRDTYIPREVLRELLELHLASDAAIAKLLSVPTSRISEARAVLGISSHRARELCVCGKKAIFKRRWCSEDCQRRVELSMRVCGLSHVHDQLEGALWALGKLNKTWCDILGMTRNRKSKGTKHEQEATTARKETSRKETSRKEGHRKTAGPTAMHRRHRSVPHRKAA